MCKNVLTCDTIPVRGVTLHRPVIVAFESDGFLAEVAAELFAVFAGEDEVLRSALKLFYFQHDYRYAGTVGT